MSYKRKSPQPEIEGGTNQSTYSTGDILYASSSNTLSKLSAGSDDEVLTLASSVPSWAAAGGGGGAWEYVSTTTISSDSSIDFTGLTGNDYMVILKKIVMSNDNSVLLLQVSNDAGSSWISTDYQYVQLYGDSSNASNPDSSGDNSSNTINLSRSVGTSSGEFGFNGNIKFYNLNEAALPLSLTWNAVYQDGNGYSMSAFGNAVTCDNGDSGSSLDIDSLRFFSGGSLTSGTIYLYKLIIA